MYAFTLGLLILASCCLGCSKKVAVDRSRIVGTYKATFEGNTEILILKSDRTYVLKRNSGQKEQEIVSNSWNLVPYGDETKVAVDGFPDHKKKMGPGGTPSVTLLGVEENRGGLRLYFSYDLNLYYSKSD